MENVRNIGTRAFSGCTSLAVLEAPAAENIGENAFYNTAYYNDKNNWESGVLYFGSFLIKAEKDITECVVKPGTKYIVKSAFSNTAIENVVFPETLSVIGALAFSDCTALKSVTIPESVKEIGYGTFDDCDMLSDINIATDEGIKIYKNAFYNTAYYNSEDNWEDGALYIGNVLIRVRENREGDFKVKNGTISIAAYAFENCGKLGNVVIPEGVLNTTERTFWNAIEKSIFLPKSLRRIEDLNYTNVRGTESIYFGGSIDDWNEKGGNESYIIKATVYFNRSEEWDNE